MLVLPLVSGSVVSGVNERFLGEGDRHIEEEAGESVVRGESSERGIGMTLSDSTPLIVVFV